MPANQRDSGACYVLVIFEGFRRKRSSIISLRSLRSLRLKILRRASLAIRGGFRQVIGQGGVKPPHSPTQAANSNIFPILSIFTPLKTLKLSPGILKKSQNFLLHFLK